MQMPDMKRAAIGIQMHPGWGALVAVSNSAGTIEVIDRRRVAITAPGNFGSQSGHHFANNLELPEAEKFPDGVGCIACAINGIGAKPPTAEAIIRDDNDLFSFITVPLS